jgi:hypothetical protein
MILQLQRTAGNAAVNALLRQYAQAGTTGLGEGAPVQRAATKAGPLQLKREAAPVQREAEDEELQTKLADEPVQRSTGSRPEPEPFMTRPETRDLIVSVTGFGDEFDKSDMIDLVKKGFLSHSLGGRGGPPHGNGPGF